MVAHVGTCGWIPNCLKSVRGCHNCSSHKNQSYKKKVSYILAKTENLTIMGLHAGRPSPPAQILQRGVSMSKDHTEAEMKENNVLRKFEWCRTRGAYPEMMPTASTTRSRNAARQVHTQMRGFLSGDSIIPALFSLPAAMRCPCQTGEPVSTLATHTKRTKPRSQSLK